MRGVIRCHGCSTRQATVQEKKGQRLPFCSVDCQKIFYQALETVPVGYGIFGFVCGPPGRPHDEPPNLTNLFTTLVKQSLDAMRVAGARPTLAATLAEHLEMMFLPADAIPGVPDPGFTTAQRERVFALIFDARRTPEMRTAFGIDDLHEFAAYVLKICLERGFVNTAHHMTQKGYVSIWDVLSYQDVPGPLFQRITTLPLDRRVAILDWLLTVLPLDELRRPRYSELGAALADAVVSTDNVPLMVRLPVEPTNRSSPAFFRAAARFTSLNVARYMIETLCLYVWELRGFQPLLEALRVEPFGSLQQDMVTLLLRNMAEEQGDIRDYTIYLVESMRRNRPDVFGYIVRIAPAAVDVVIKWNTVNAAVDHNDHEFIRAYALSIDQGPEAWETLRHLIIRTRQTGLTEALWQDVEMLRRKCPEVDSMPILVQAAAERNPDVVYELVVLPQHADFYIMQTHAVNANSDQLLRMLLRHTPPQGAKIAELLSQIAEKNAAQSLRATIEELRLSFDVVVNALYWKLTPLLAPSLLAMFGDKPEHVRFLAQKAIDAPGEEPGTPLYSRMTALLAKLMEIHPRAFWDEWQRFKPMLERHGLEREVAQLEQGQARRTTGKAQRVKDRLFLG